MNTNKITRNLSSGIILVLLMLLASCGGGGGGTTATGPATPVSSTINGVATKGPVVAGTATAYALTNGVIGASLGTATTDANGNYSISIDNYSGPVLVEITGGTYVDEATGNTVALSGVAGSGLTAVVESVASGQTVQVQVTAVTTQATQLAAGKSGGLTAANIRVANEQIGQFYGGLDIINTQPVNPLVPGSTTGASQAAIDYGLILAGISQQAETLGLSDPMEVVNALARDISDSVFDGQAGGAPIALSNATQLLSTAGTVDLANAIDTFSNDAGQNASGATPSNGLSSDLQSSTGELGIEPPTGVSATGGAGQVTVSWDDVSGATSYNLYYGTSPGLTKNNGIQSLGVSSPFTVTGLSDGVTYYFIVTANTASGESVASDIVSATTDQGTTPPPSVPSVLGAYVTNLVTTNSTGCVDPADNGLFTFDAGSLTIASQTDANFSGSMVFQVDVGGSTAVSTLQLTGSVTANGALSGTFTSTFTVDGIFDSGGNGSFTGQASGNTVDMQVNGQDTAGDTCSYTATSTFTKQ